MLVPRCLVCLNATYCIEVVLDCICGRVSAMSPDTWNRQVLNTFHRLVNFVQCNLAVHFLTWMQYFDPWMHLWPRACNTTWHLNTLHNVRFACGVMICSAVHCDLKSMYITKCITMQSQNKLRCILNVYIHIYTYIYIWVRFPRTGILAKMCHFFEKSRAFVWPNLMRYFWFFNWSWSIVSLRPWKHFSLTLQNFSESRAAPLFLPYWVMFG